MPPARLSDLPPANRIFVDREEPQRVFEMAAFAIPADRAALRVFYGIGGQGKTALCRELIRKTGPGGDPSYGFLRCALLDLHGRPKTDPDLLLVWIRSGFAEAGIDLPAFDLALALAWEASRGEAPFPTLTKPWLGRATGTARNAVDEGGNWLGSDTAKEMIGEAVGEIPGVGFLARRLGNWVIDRGKRAYLDRTRDSLKRLHDDAGALRPPHELSALLPWMLAQDLNHYVARHPAERLVLFIDEYERVFEQGGAGARWVENPFDRHMRALLGETNGLLAVFFSRERLPWEADTDWRDDLAGHQHLLGGLADADADAFLAAIPIEDAAIRAAIIDGARERAGAEAPVYPLMLDLQVEHWRNLSAKGQAAPERFTVEAETSDDRCIKMIKQVLRDYGDPLQTTIERLSVAQRFDRAAFACVVKTFGTAVPQDSFERIADLSFVTRAPDGFLSLHDVVAVAIRSQLDEDKRRTSIDALLDHYTARARVESHFDLTDAHVLALFEAASLRWAQGAEGYVTWLFEIVEPLQISARYAEATALWRNALTLIETALYSNHPDTIKSLNNLAFLLNVQGDYAGARPFYERALAMREEALEPNHLDTALSLNNLAGLLRDQGDYAGAKPLCERALAIHEMVLGPNHPDTAISLNNLADLLNNQGDYARAKPLYERALAIQEMAFGPDHPGTAISLNNLAGLLSNQGDYAGAKPLCERALIITEEAFGPNHPQFARILNNFAGLLIAQGDCAGAKPLYERALFITEESLGPSHPNTVTSLNNLAKLLSAQREYEKAKPLYERALAIAEKTLGHDHPNTATSLNNLAGLLDNAGAEPLYKRALAICEKALGLNHPTTRIVRENLESVLSGRPIISFATGSYTFKPLPQPPR
ncbi:MAG: tetratricopeptide repeat protein [Methylorubrum rhodinum]|uniref:tetratricopeptide repeat protein n=1 Tax=Methylorubrum rhodinum TaxID=29428 RepID=UPI003BAF52DE